MLKPDTWRVVLSYLSPGRSDFTQNDWRHLVGRSIVPEVKQEIIRFYGTDNEPESTYPGLDYANPNHRLRLGSFPFHDQLFQAFDALNLTYDEIYMLCKWHGTKRSRDDYERRHAFKIPDTTLEDVQPYTRSRVTVIHHDIANVMEASTTEVLEMPHDEPICEDEDMEHGADHESEVSVEEHVDASDEESEDEVQRSVGVELNQRLLANAEANMQARARGEQVSMDMDWEQWVKEAAEREAAQGSISQGLAHVLASVTTRAGGSVSDLALSLSQTNSTQEAATSATVDGTRER